MTTSGSFWVSLAWTALLVTSELIAFYLIQKSVDDNSGINAGVIISALLFGIIVTYSFRQILINGANIPLANLFWIFTSQIGSLLVAYLFFNHRFYMKDMISIVLLLTALLVVYFG